MRELILSLDGVGWVVSLSGEKFAIFRAVHSEGSQRGTVMAPAISDLIASCERGGKLKI